MEHETFQTIEVLLVEAKNRARVVYDGFSRGQAGEQSAYCLHSDICKALAHLRVLSAMNV